MRVDAPAARFFHTLDGLRGLAALAVLLWHLPHRPLLRSGYLAVDFFFMLSGFVLANHYEARLATARGGRRFMTMRLIRLYPLYVLGTAIGGAFALYSILTGTIDRSLTWWLRNAAFAAPMLPNVLSHNAVFAFNPPAWSLFFEVMVNVLYGFTARWTSDRVLLAIIGGSAAVLVIAVARIGNMHFTVHMPMFLLGGVRAAFGFYVGVGIQRLWRRGQLPRLRVPPLMLAALLIACLTIPRGGDRAPGLTLAVVFVGFPAILIAALYNEPGRRLARIALRLGLLSFPVYAIHRPVFSIVRHVVRPYHPSLFVTAICAIPLSLVLAWLAARFYDQPLRRWLTRRLVRA